MFAPVEDTSAEISAGPVCALTFHVTTLLAPTLCVNVVFVPLPVSRVIVTFAVVRAGSRLAMGRYSCKCAHVAPSANSQSEPRLWAPTTQLPPETTPAVPPFTL